MRGIGSRVLYIFTIHGSLWVQNTFFIIFIFSVLKVTVRHIVVVLGVGAELGGESTPDVLRLSFRKSVREHFKVGGLVTPLPDDSHVHEEK